MFRSVAVALSLALAIAGCQYKGPSNGENLLEYLLLTPTYNPHYVPQTYGTPYDCKTASQKYGAANVWRANVGGRTYDIDNQRPVGREGCFQTQAECIAFLNLMEGYIDIIIMRTCRKGYT